VQGLIAPENAIAKKGTGQLPGVQAGVQAGLRTALQLACKKSLQKDFVGIQKIKT